MSLGVALDYRAGLLALALTTADALALSMRDSSASSYARCDFARGELWASDSIPFLPTLMGTVGENSWLRPAMDT